MLDKISAGYNKFGDWLGILSTIILVGGMLLTVGNIVLRQFGSPFGGTAEVIGYTSATLTALALIYSQKKKAHVAVDVLASRFAKRPRAILNGIWYLIGTVVFAMAAWQVFVRAGMMQRSGILSDTLQMAYYPFLWVLGVCVALFAIRLLIDSLLKFKEATAK